MTATHTPGPWTRTNLTIHTQSTAQRGALGLARVFDWIETDGVTDASEATASPTPSDRQEPHSYCRIFVAHSFRCREPSGLSRNR